jgi:hypothetical protein
MRQTAARGPGEADHHPLLPGGPAVSGSSRGPARHARPGPPGLLVAAPVRPGRPRAPHPARLQVVIAGAHGGAGVSTLAGLLRLQFAGTPAGRQIRVLETPPIPDADPAQIARAGWLPVPPPGMPLIIAARGTAEGARRAVIAVTALERRGLRPAAVAVIADGAGPEPRLAAQRLDLIDGRAGPLIRIPFAVSLRAGASPSSARLSRRLRAAVTGLAALAVTAPPGRG